MSRIETLEDLHALYPSAVEASLRKVANRLTPLYRQWIMASRLCVIATVGPEGTDASPRGDDGPVVVEQDDRTLLMPDWMGNNRLDTLRNIIRDPRVALMFMVAGSNTVVRVNGRAWISSDDDLRQRFERRGKHPATVIGIDIAEVYAQCPKALMRAGVWDRDDSDGLPTMGQILAEMTQGDMGGARYDDGYAERAKDRMW